MPDWIATFAGILLNVFGQTPDCQAQALQNRAQVTPETSRDFQLWEEIRSSIDLANDILGPDRRFEVTARWKAPHETSLNPQQKITVYIVDGVGGVSGGAAFRNAAREALKSFRAHEGNIKLNEAVDRCQDGDPDDCIIELYDNTTTRLAGEVINRIAAVDAAKADAKCPVIIFDRRDLEVYDQILNIRNADGGYIAQRFLLVPILLHEVGHLIPGDPSVNSSWRNQYHALASTMSAEQQEELRADAYAAKAIVDGCKRRPYSEDRKEACMAVLVQWFMHYRYMLFDRSRSGLCRLYLPYSQRHPNMLLRVLMQGFIVSNEMGSGPGDFFQKEIERHLKTARLLLGKPWISAERGCERAAFARPD